MVVLRLFSYASWSVLVSRSTSAVEPLRGVAPEDWGKYTCDSEPCTYSCLSTLGDQIKLPYTSLNDDFCECEDGSDEPGTDACAGQSETFFYCPNINSAPMKIYSSRVNDGICDCCDGSDEFSNSVCQNFCEEEGVIVKERHEKQVALLREGIEKKGEYRERGKETRPKWEDELTKLEAELPDLELRKKAADEAKEAADKEKENEGNVEIRLGKLTDLVEKMQQELVEQRKLISELQTRQDELTAENKKCQSIISTSSLVTGDRETKEKQSEQSEEKPEQNEEKKVSEYAKWMDSAADVQQASGGGGDQDPANLEEEGEATKDFSSASDTSQDSASASSSNDNDGSADPEELGKKVDKMKRRIKRLKRYLEALPEERLNYFSLADKCISKEIDKYKYKFCFLKNVFQDDVKLGRWSKWEGEHELFFNRGQDCQGKLKRQLRMKFTCGTEEEILEVNEPSLCQYEALVASPGACDTENMKALQEAAPAVRMPKDEL